MSTDGIFGSYEIVGEIGSGGRTRVFVARVRGTVGEEKRVALRVLHPHLARVPEHVSAFLADARAASGLRHSNVVATLDVGATPDGVYYAAVDLVTGLSLAALKERIAIPQAIARRVVLDVLDGLAHVHEARDEWGRPLGLVPLSARNVLVGADGRARLSDFGTAREGVAQARFDPAAVMTLLGACDSEATFARALPLADPRSLTEAIRRSAGEIASSEEVAAFVQAAARPEAPRTPQRAAPHDDTLRTATPFVGRREELARALALLDRGERAITLTGLGGIGKTRLLREIANARSHAQGPPTVWVDLGDLVDAAAFEPRLAGSFGAPDVRALPDLLAARGPMVLLLDNLEQLVPDVVSPLERILASAPALQVVSTSRIALSLAGEHVIEILPLEVPVESQPLGASAAGQMMIALLTRRGIPATDEASLGAIARAIGGIPLAIELVVGRLDTLAPGEVLARLDRQLALLSRADRPERRWSTMEACIEWSWSLLTPDEQNALAQWSVFEGTFRASWAEATGGPRALDVLAALRAHSLVQRRVQPGDAHSFDIVPPVREFALERLARRGGQGDARQVHAEAFVALARGGWHEAIDAASPAARALAAASREFVTAIVRALEGTIELEADAVAALFAALGATIEHLRAGHRLEPHLERAVERVRGTGDATAAMALAAIARIASAFQRGPLAMGTSELAIERAQGADPRTFAEVSRAFSYAMGSAGHDTEAIEAALERALPGVRAAGDLPSEARLLFDLADLARWRLDAKTSVALFDLVLERLDPDGAMLGDAARVYSGLAEALLALGDVERARTAIERVFAAPQLPATLAVVTRGRAAVLEILAGDPEAALRIALGCMHDAAAFPLVMRQARMYAAIATIGLGRAKDAGEHLAHAMRGARLHERALIDGIAVLALVAGGHAASAREAAAATREAIQSGVRPAARIAAESSLEIALLQLRPEPPRNLLRQLDAILARPFGAHGAAGNHIAVRALAEVVRRALMLREAEDDRPRGTPGTLLVSHDTRWLITPDGEWVDCARRPMIGQLVAVLARQHGEWIEAAALCAELWPGDRASSATLRNRLHALVASVKKLGLADRLESRRGAYRLAAALPIEWWTATA